MVALMDRMRYRQVIAGKVKYATRKPLRCDTYQLFGAQEWFWHRFASASDNTKDSASSKSVSFENRQVRGLRVHFRQKPLPNTPKSDAEFNSTLLPGYTYNIWGVL